MSKWHFLTITLRERKMKANPKITEIKEERAKKSPDKNKPDDPRPKRPPMEGGGPDQRRPLRDELDISFGNSPAPKTDEEKKILNVLKEIYQKQWIQNVSMADGRLLRILVETTNAKNVVEIGASNGCSGLWLSLALQSTGGKLASFEMEHERAELARENFKQAGVENIITFIEGDAHKEIEKLKDQIDIVFLDADREGNLDYLNKLLPLVRLGGLILSHNMSSPPRGISPRPDPKYIEAITTNPELETIFLNMDDSGFGVTLKKRLWIDKIERKKL
jgi:caffeoyl-CoA O-methyltransferase